MWLDLVVVLCILATLVLQSLMLFLMKRGLIRDSRTANANHLDQREALAKIKLDILSARSHLAAHRDELLEDFKALREQLSKRAETYLANHNASDAILVATRASADGAYRASLGTVNQISNMHDDLDALVEAFEKKEKKRGRKKQPNRKTT